MNKQQLQAELFGLVDDMNKSLEAAIKAPLMLKQPHLERLAKQQQRFNQKIAKAVCYG